MHSSYLLPILHCRVVHVIKSFVIARIVSVGESVFKNVKVATMSLDGPILAFELWDCWRDMWSPNYHDALQSLCARHWLLLTRRQLGL